MYKCIYNKDTGQVYAMCVEGQDFDQLASNYTNWDWFETDTQFNKYTFGTYRVDINTKEFVKIS